MTSLCVGDVLAGRYELVDQIQLGLAEVWEARQLPERTPVVLKCSPRPRPSDRDRLAREARAFDYLGPVPGLVRFFGYETDETHGPFLVLEYVSGQPLSAFLSSRLSERVVVEVVGSLCRILKPMHEKGVVHRDLSLNNVLWRVGSGPLEVRLLDLGVSLVPTANGEGYEPHDKGRVGTPSTLAPELSDSFSGDVRSDLYSLGRLLLLLTAGEELQDAQHLHPDSVEHVSKELSDIVVRCLKLKPEKRYQTVAELEGALMRIPLHQAASKAKRITVGAVQLGAAVFSFGLASLYVLGARFFSEVSSPPSSRPVLVQTPSEPPAPHPPVEEIAKETLVPQPISEPPKKAKPRRETKPTGHDAEDWRKLVEMGLR